MVVNAFIFSLDTEFLVTSVEEVQAIADSTILEAVDKKDPVPPKFYLCKTAAYKMLRHDPINKREVLAMVDVIGGYFSATAIYCRDHGGQPDQLKHAQELMRFAGILMKNVKPLWGLELVRDED